MSEPTPFLWPRGEIDADSATANDSEGGVEFRGTRRFSVVRKIGGGGMGMVYEVHDHERKCNVAVKVLRRLKPSSLLLFKTEFRSLQDIAHPNLVSLGELFEEGGLWFFTMELVHGLDYLSFVRGHLFPKDMQPDSATTKARSPSNSQESSFVPAYLEQRYSPLSLQRLRSSLKQLCQGLLALHRSHKVHRDVKPSNILVTSEERVVLLDFGLVADWRHAGEKGLFGTLSYMAPEQVDGHISPAADWYSVGVMLYRALTGQLPFSGTEVDVVRTKREGMPRRPSEWVDEVPKDLEALCLDLLRPEPKKRPSGVEILHRLAAHDAGRPLVPWTSNVRGFSTSELSRSPPFVGRNREHAEVKKALDKVQTGRGTAVFIEGESGVGKSALMRSCLDSLTQAVVLESRCYERESIRYKGVDGIVDALTRYLLTLPPEEVEAIAPSKAHLLRRMFPVLGRVEAFSAGRNTPLVELDPIRLRMQTFGAFRELLWRLAERVTLVIAVDDLQWADADSILLLSDALKSPDSPPLLFLATLRLSAESMAVATAFDGKILDDFHRYKLEPLSPDDAQELARSLFPSGDTAVADAIAKEAGGHPLFIAELTRASGHSGPGEGKRARSLDEALWERIQQLPDEAQTILRLTAVAGHPLEQGVLAEAAAAQSFAEFSDHVSTLRNATFVRTSGLRPSNTLETYHDRVREAITSHLDNTAQRMVHRSLAATLEKRQQQSSPVTPETLALHWREAGEPEKAADYAAEAGVQASTSLAFERAVAFYKMALDLNARSAQATDWQIRLAEALANLGRSAEAGECYLSALKTAEPQQSFELRRRAADQLLRSGRVDEGLHVLKMVLSAVHLSYPRTKIGIIWGLLLNRARIALSLSKRSMSTQTIVTKFSETASCQIDVCWSTAIGLSFVDLFRAAFFHSCALLLALKLRRTDSIVPALCLQAIYHENEGKGGRTKATRTLETARALSAKSRDPYVHSWIDIASGFSCLDRGQYKAAIDHLASAAQMLRSDCRGAVWETEFAEFYAIHAFIMLGDFRAATIRYNSLLKESSVRGNLFATRQSKMVLGHMIHLAQNNPHLCEQDIAELALDTSQRTFDLLRVFHFSALINVALFSNTASDRHAILDREWKLFQKSSFRRSDNVSMWLSDGRARLLLSLANSKTERKEALLSEAQSLATRVRRSISSPSTAFSSLLFA